MKSRAPLNHVQEAVLRWIAADCPPGVVEGHSYKTTAAALQNRKLVTISKKAGRWTAALTPAGQYYVTHCTYPPAVAGPEWRPPPVRPPSTSPSAGVAPTHTPAPAVSKTVALIQEIQAAGGTLIVERSSRRLQLVSLAIRHGKVPAGMRLYEQNVNGRTEIRLEPLPEWIPELAPIPVPLTLRGASTVITDLRDGDDLKVKGTTRSRALRLLQALIATAESRGYPVKANTVKRTWQDTRPVRSGLFTITIRGHEVGVDVGAADGPDRP